MKDLTLPTPALPPHEVMQKALDALAPRVSKQCSGRVEWRIMNKAEDAYCMVFTHDDYINPERAAREWMEQTTRERPGWIESNGYHAMPKLIFTESERLAIEAVELLRAALSHHEDGGRAEPVWCSCGDAITPDTGAKCGVCASGVALGGEKGEPPCSEHPDAREAALEQAANLVECEYAENATQDRRLKQIAQHIRDLKKRNQS